MLPLSLPSKTWYLYCSGMNIDEIVSWHLQEGKVTFFAGEEASCNSSTCRVSNLSHLSSVWKTLLDKKVPRDIKDTAIRRIQTLANGDWRGGLSKPLAGLPKECNIKLYEAKLDKARRILWELTIVFSPRLTGRESEKMLESGIDDSTQTARYSEAIRVWDIVLDHSKVAHAMDVIMQKVKQGKRFKKRKSLMGISEGKTSKGTKFRSPTVFRVVKSEQFANNDKMLHELCPPGEDEYRVMKLYSFTSMLVNAVLNNSQVEVEFPFRVTELEHAIINLQPEPPSSILLLGRSGTVNLAATVVDLLDHFFPLSFDRLLPDQALFDGPLPVILDTSDVKDLPSLLGNWMTPEETSEIEFGAHQVILVASSSVKQVVMSNTASGKPLAMFDKGIVMTIEEAKGLEFDDVLLYNFFKDSEGMLFWQAGLEDVCGELEVALLALQLMVHVEGEQCVSMAGCPASADAGQIDGDGGCRV
ncbi:TPR and ankyrin repeat-containing protein 1-like [Patiria miniata]|uniref:Uncharacterized protein n=1 Tax=Patiria miniata TaxID=46514 RepID=A0A913ZWL1_PATMI|nr:TPR and ankyrin repeat-containing protein 1-like [Patiria miniata]